VKSIFDGGSLAAATLVIASLLLTVQPSAAETPPSQFPQQLQQKPLTVQKQEDAEVAIPETANHEPAAPASSNLHSDALNEPEANEQKAAVSPSVSYLATAYSLRGRTASGAAVSKGMIAADPRFLPLGSRVRLEAGGYSGEYMVADTGGAVRGRRIDIWTPTSREALRFGRRIVKLTVLSYGGRHAAGKRPTP